MRVIVVVAIAAIAAIAAAPMASRANEVTLGDDTAHACFEVSHSSRTDSEAVHICDVALDGDGMKAADRGGALINRGVIRMRRGELALAQRDFDAGIALIPDVAEAWFNRGAVLIGEHRYKDALTDLDKAITLGVPEPAKAYYYRGIAHDYLDNETAAYQDYKQAEALAPDWDLPKHELRRFAVTRK